MQYNVHDEIKKVDSTEQGGNTKYRGNDAETSVGNSWVFRLALNLKT